MVAILDRRAKKNENKFTSDGGILREEKIYIRVEIQQ